MKIAKEKDKDLVFLKELRNEEWFNSYHYSIFLFVFHRPIFSRRETLKLFSQIEGGEPLIQCLKLRQSSREFSQEKFSPQILSNLLWAAYGINRPESGKRAAPSAVNWQNIDIYVATEDGLFLYDAKEHVLIQITKEDIRALTGTQEFVKTAPLNLIYVGDFSKIPRGTDEDKRFYSAAHTGFISRMSIFSVLQRGFQQL